MEGILSSAGSIVTTASGWIGTFANVVSGNPILLMFALVPIVGLGIGLLKRLLNVN